MNFYERAGASALKLLKKYGQSATLKRTETTTSPLKPWEPGASTTVSYPVTCVVADFSEKMIDGSTIIYGDKRVIVAAKDMPVVPCVSDVIAVGATEYTIINVKTIAPAGAAVVYELHARN